MDDLYAEFKAAERDGWDTLAKTYDDFTGRFSPQAVDAMLGVAAVGHGVRLLDIACGPGYACARATERGAVTVGLDFAPGMIKEANKRFSGQKFLLGDAEALPFDSASFDVALCSFGLMHMAYPDRAISEACRILKAGGRYVFTVWTAPERARFFALVNDAVNRYGDIGVRMPPAPPMFRFAERAECARTLAEFGFSKVQFQELPLTWRPASTTEFLDYIYKSSVRMPLLLAPQKPWMLRKIHAAIMEGASAFLIDGKFEVPWPALMVCGTKLST